MLVIGKEKCSTPHFTDDEIKAMFLKAYSQLLGVRESSIEDCEVLYDMVTNTTILEDELTKQREEINVVTELISKQIHENAASSSDQAEYQKKYNSLVNRYKRAQKKHESISDEITGRKLKGNSIRLFITSLKKNPTVLDTWDDEIWTTMVEKGSVHTDGSITFTFNSGQEICVEKV